MKRGLLLLHAWWGLNKDVLARAERLRADGFEVLSPDLFGGKVATTIEQAQAQTAAESEHEAEITRMVEAAFADLSKRADRIAVVAWSFGCWYAWKLGIAHPDALRGLVLFYGIGPNEPAAPAVPVLAHYAEHDPYEDLAFARTVEKEMRQAGSDITVELYPGTKHWFDEPSRPEFDGAASGLAWRRNAAFFEKHLR